MLAMERVLPNSNAAEMAILGAMLYRSKEVGSEVRSTITEEHFYYATHKLLFREFCDMQDAGLNVDLFTISERFRSSGRLEEIGGDAYLTELISASPTSQTEDHARIIIREHTRRKIIGLAHDAITRGFDDHDIDAWLPALQQSLLDINEVNSADTKPFREHIKNAMEAVEGWIANKGKTTGLSTGYRDIDRITNGLQKANMIVIAGRPSMGKTTLAMNIAENVVLRGEHVGVFSLEMSVDELAQRTLASEARVNFRKLQAGYGSERDYPKLTTAASRLMKVNLHVDDTPALTISQLRARARRMKLRHGVVLLVIDYLQLLKSPSRRSDNSSQSEITDVSKGVKALAKELQIPIIATAQLNRSPDSREDGVPKMSDLRESGQIEQDADVLGLLIRPEVYTKDEAKKAELKGSARLIIAKQRNGPIGDIDMTFIEDWTRFEDAAKTEPPLPSVKPYNGASNDY